MAPIATSPWFIKSPQPISYCHGVVRLHYDVVLLKIQNRQIHNYFKIKYLQGSGCYKFFVINHSYKLKIDVTREREREMCWRCPAFARKRPKIVGINTPMVLLLVGGGNHPVNSLKLSKGSEWSRNRRRNKWE